MAFIPLPNGVKVELKWTSNGVAVVNILWFTKAIINISVDFPLLGAALVEWWGTTQASSFPSTIQLDEVVITDWREEGGEQLIFNTLLPIAGTNSSPALPNNVALVVTKKSIFTGRSSRGRRYICGLTEGNVSGNTVGGTFATDIAAGEVALYEGAADAGWQGVIASFEHNNAPRTSGVAVPIAFISANTRVDTQRRRLD